MVGLLSFRHSEERKDPHQVIKMIQYQNYVFTSELFNILKGTEKERSYGIHERKDIRI
jgi:hypothetical protein